MASHFRVGVRLLEELTVGEADEGEAVLDVASLLAAYDRADDAC